MHYMYVCICNNSFNVWELFIKLMMAFTSNIEIWFMSALIQGQQLRCFSVM